MTTERSFRNIWKEAELRSVEQKIDFYRKKRFILSGSLPYARADFVTNSRGTTWSVGPESGRPSSASGCPLDVPSLEYYGELTGCEAKLAELQARRSALRSKCAVEPFDSISLGDSWDCF